jgi:hypothetical protein
MLSVKAILLNADAIKIDQDPGGQMGFRLNSTALSQLWARPLANGDVAVALYNKRGGSPAGIVTVEEGACVVHFDQSHTRTIHYTTMKKIVMLLLLLLLLSYGGTLTVALLRWHRYCSGVNADFGFGHTLESCRDDVQKNATENNWQGYFYFSQEYNGQCTAATDQCSKRTHNSVYSIYQLQPHAPAMGLDIVLDFSQVLPFPSVTTAATHDSGKPAVVVGGGGKVVEVYDVWEQKSLGSFTGSFTAKNVSHHGNAFLRLTPK